MPDDRQVLIATLPGGPLKESDYQLTTAPLPEPRNHGRAGVSPAG